MTQLYDPRIIEDYPAYFCRGVQQAANLLHRLSSACHNGGSRNKYKLKTADYLILGSANKISQTLDSGYDFNTHTVNEMFEFLCVLSRMDIVAYFGQAEIQLQRSQDERLEKIGEGNYSEEIRNQIQKLDFTTHAKTNAFRAGRFPNIEGAR
jgi:hypothetical protein